MFQFQETNLETNDAMWFIVGGLVDTPYFPSSQRSGSLALIINRFIAGAVGSHPYLPSSQPNISENLPLRNFHPVTMPTLKTNMVRRHSAFQKNSDIPYQARSGARVVTSWTSHVLPSGSLKDKN